MSEFPGPPISQWPTCTDVGCEVKISPQTEQGRRTRPLCMKHIGLEISRRRKEQAAAAVPFVRSPR